MTKDTHDHDGGRCCECGDLEHCCCTCPTLDVAPGPKVRNKAMLGALKRI